MTAEGELPLPDSEELEELLSPVQRVIYRHLYENREHGLTMLELRELCGPEVGDQEQLGRRKRDLHPHFKIIKRGSGKNVRHVLVGRADRKVDVDDGVSGKTRYRVLSKGRCDLCGKTPQDDGVKLVVDHIIPRAWGGPSEEWNLRPLCEQCNLEKKHFLTDFDRHADAIRAAMKWADPQQRIGELLKAFAGERIPADLVQIVAAGGEHRVDWTRRFRDLRALGWDVRVRRFKKDGRWTAEYWVEHWEPWPKGPLHEAVARGEEARRRHQDAEDRGTPPEM